MVKTQITSRRHSTRECTHGFKFEAPDGKQRKADVLDSEAVTILTKNNPNNRANVFFDWFTYSDNTIDGQSQKKAYQLYESGLLQRLEPGTLKCLQQIHTYIFGCHIVMQLVDILLHHIVMLVILHKKTYLKVW